MKNNASKLGLAHVCKLIEEQMGLHFPIDRWNILTRNLSVAMGEFGFQHFDDFLSWLISTPLDKQQIQTLASFLTVSETYFWREEPVFLALTEHLIPQLILSKANDKKTIRIWSAGCSSGEEVYSLAIAFHRSIPNIREWDIKVLGTDINPVALKKAREGIYSKWSFRNCPDWLKASYFRRLEDDNYEIIPKIKKLVEFQSVNLTEELFPSFLNNLHSFDIIFCRNVLMYLTEDWITKIAQNFHRSLNQNGWFVVSSCELSSQRFSEFNPVNFSGAVLYNKDKNELNRPVLKFLPDNPFTAETAKKIPDEVKAEPIFTPQNTILTPLLNVPEVIPETPLPEEMAQLPDQGAEVIERVRQIANAGDLAKALQFCNDSLSNHKLSRDLYFLRASILQEMNRPDEAFESLKKAIYLDPKFIMGYFVLGNLCLQEGKLKQAKKYFNNVLEMLNSCPDDEILPESEGLSAKYMREIIVPNMQKLTHL